MLLRNISYILSTLLLVGALKYTDEINNLGLNFIEIGKAKVSYDTYTLVYHIDLREFIDLRERVENYTAKIGSKCIEFDQDDEGKICIRIIQSLRNEIAYMYTDEQNIMAYQQSNTHSVHKRAIEWMGSVLHWATGVMDAKTARKYDTHINKIVNETSRLSKMQNEQLILIRETIETMDNKFRESQQEFNFFLNRIKPWLVKLGYEVELIGIHTTLQSLINEHQRIAFKILRSLENAKANTIDHLIPAKSLAKDLLSIEKSLRVSQMLPVNCNLENPLSIFKYSKTAATIYNNRLLLELQLPIIEREQYIIYEIIPIPNFINNKTIMIKPSTNYLLINTGMSEYIPISESELHRGHTDFHDEKVITPHENAHMDFSDSCETSIYLAPKENVISKSCDIKFIPTMNYFIPINHNNIYYVTIFKPITVLETCAGGQINSYDLTRSGRMILQDGCQVSTDKINIRPRVNYRLESKSELPISNRTLKITLDAFTQKTDSLKNITLPAFDKDIIITDYSIDLDRLATQADKLIEESRWKSKIEEIHYDSVGRSNVIYWIIGIVVIIIIIVGVLLVIYAYYKFYNINTWVSLVNRLGSKDPEKVSKFMNNNFDANNV